MDWGLSQALDKRIFMIGDTPYQRKEKSANERFLEWVYKPHLVMILKTQKQVLFLIGVEYGREVQREQKSDTEERADKVEDSNNGVPFCGFCFLPIYFTSPLIDL